MAPERASLLTELPGIGPAKAKAIHRHFGTVAAMRGATREQFEAVSGITKRDADSLWRYFNED